MYNKMMKMVCDEFEEFQNKGVLTAANLDQAYKLVLMKEKLLRIEELEEKMGYSQDAHMPYMGYSRRGGEWDAHGSYGRSYDNGNSYLDRRYSRDDGYAMMGSRLEDMLNDPNLTERERKAIKVAMENMR